MGIVTYDFNSAFDDYWSPDDYCEWSWQSTYASFSNTINTAALLTRNWHIRGNITVEAKCKFATWGSTNAKYFYLRLQASLVAAYTYKREIYIGGTDETDVELNGTLAFTDFDTTSWWWFKIEQNGTQWIYSYKKDGDPSYTQINTSVGAAESAIFDIYGTQLQLRCYDSSYDKDQLEVHVDEIRITADDQGEDGTWLTTLEPSLRYSFIGSDNEFHDSSTNYHETFDGNFEIDNWNNVSVLEDHRHYYDDAKEVLRLNYPLEYDGGSSTSYFNQELRVRQDIDARIKFGLHEFPSDQELYFFLGDTALTDYVEVSLEVSSVNSDLWNIVCWSDYGGNYYYKWTISNFYFGRSLWYWLRFKVNGNNVEIYLRPDGGDWTYIGLAYHPLSYWDDGAVLFFRHFSNTTRSEFVTEIDEILIDATYSEWRDDVWATADIDFYAPNGYFGAGYELMDIMRFSDNDRLLTSILTVPIPAVIYHPTYIYYTLNGYGGTQDPKGFYFTTKIEGNFIFMWSQWGHTTANANYPFAGMHFTVNGIDIYIGYIYCSLSYDIWGVIIDGTEYLHSDLTPSFSAECKLKASLIDGTFTVTIETSTDPSPETVVSISNFLGSPTTYTTGNVALYKNGIDYTDSTYSGYFEFYGEIALPPDVAGDLALTSEEPFTQFSITITPPPDLVSEAFFFHKTSLTGGTGDDLDGINPSSIESTGQTLKEGSACLTVTSTNEIYLHIAELDSEAVSDSPNVIIPTTNPGNWAWKRSTTRAFDSYQTFTFPNLVANTPVAIDADDAAVIRDGYCFPAFYNSGASKYSWHDFDIYLNDTIATDYPGSITILAFPDYLSIKGNYS